MNNGVSVYVAILKKPFPIHNWRWYQMRAAGFGLFVFLFLFLFKPFGMNLFTPVQLLYVTLVYGAITGIVLLTGGWVFVKKIAPQKNEERWTLGKQILWNVLMLLCIAILNSLVTQWMHRVVVPVWWYFLMLKWVVMLGVLPVAMADLISYNYYLRQNLKRAGQLSQKISLHEPRLTMMAPLVRKLPDIQGITLSHYEAAIIAEGDGKEKFVAEVDTGTILLLTGENQGDLLELPAQALLAAQALDNYVNIFWEEDGRLKTTLLRNTLTNLVEQLNNESFFYRTHRGWIVNTRRVTQVEGNAQGLKLSVDLMQVQVPVSRTNIHGYRQKTSG